jgi:hypothetical protein
MNKMAKLKNSIVEKFVAEGKVSFNSGPYLAEKIMKSLTNKKSLSM